MNPIIFPEDVINTMQNFLLSNHGDEATEELIISIGADLLDISYEEMWQALGDDWMQPYEEVM